MNFRAYLAKRLVIEKGYGFWGPQDPSDPHPEPLITPENFPFHQVLLELPELQPLRKYFDLILLRLNGYIFDVICFKKRALFDPEPTYISQATLIEVGKACLQQYMSQVYGTRLPIKFQVWEIFATPPTAEDYQRLKALQRVPGFTKVGITALAINEQSGEVWSSIPSLQRPLAWNYLRYIEKIVAEQGISDDELAEKLRSAGIKPLPLLGGIFATVLPQTLLWLLWPTASESVVTFCFLIMGIVAVMIAIYAREIRIKNEQQGALAAILYLASALGFAALVQENSLFPHFIAPGIALIFFGHQMGSMVEP